MSCVNHRRPTRARRATPPLARAVSLARAVPLASALALCACLLAARPAHADEEDLSPTSRRSSQIPAVLIVRAEGGSNFSPYGNAGACLSYYNDTTDSELEVGAGAGFPGLQLGLGIRKLLGDHGDFFVSELSLGYNNQISRGVDPLNPTTGTHLWLNIGIGYEHRAGIFSFEITGGLSVFSFSQTPQAFVHGGIGFGI
jgi:hypothetical protein